MSKNSNEQAARFAQTAAMIRQINNLRLSADEETRKMLDSILQDGYEAYDVVKAG